MHFEPGLGAPSQRVFLLRQKSQALSDLRACNEVAEGTGEGVKSGLNSSSLIEYIEIRRCLDICFSQLGRIGTEAKSEVVVSLLAANRSEDYCTPKPGFLKTYEGGEDRNGWTIHKERELLRSDDDNGGFVCAISIHPTTRRPARTFTFGSGLLS